jgi:hypothetical protein
MSIAGIAAVAISTGCSPAPSAPTVPAATSLPRADTVALPVGTVIDVSRQVTMTSRNYVGQSVTIPAGGPVANLRFNWYTYKEPGDQAARRQTATAFGTLYLLSQEYLGLPAGLSPSTAGFVAKSDSIVDGQYVFAPSITLTGGALYWFYTTAGGAFVTSFNVSSYPGGDMYITGQTEPMPVQPFRKSPASWLLQGDGTYQIPPPGTFQDADFRLQGSVGGS